VKARAFNGFIPRAGRGRLAVVDIKASMSLPVVVEGGGSAGGENNIKAGSARRMGLGLRPEA